MDQVRCFLKDLLQKINQDSERNHTYCPTMRFTEVASDASLMSNQEDFISRTSQVNHTLRQDEIYYHQFCHDMRNLEIDPRSPNSAIIDPNARILLNYDDMAKPPSSDDSDSFRDIRPDSRCMTRIPEIPEIKVDPPNPQYRTSLRERRPLRLRIGSFSDRLSSGNGSSPEVFDFENINGNHAGHVEHRHRSRVLMGRNALKGLKQTKEKEEDNAEVVHNLVLERYNEVLNRCSARMSRRRLSKESEDISSANSPACSSVASASTDYGHSSCFSFDWEMGHNRYGSFNFKSRRTSCSIDDANKETTVEDIPESEGLESEFDQSSFLRRALGDEQEISSNEKTSKKSRSSTNMSLILPSRSSSFYGSLKKGIRKLSFSRAEKPRTLDTISLQDFSENLTNDLSDQNRIIYQISKALNFCRNSKFENSPEHIEAERILLVANLRKDILTKEVNHGDTEEDIDNRSYGSLEISNISIPLKPMNIKIAESNCTEYFVIVVACGSTVLSSQVIQARHNLITAEKKFRLEKLKGDFCVTLSVYSTKVWNKYDDDKHHKDLKDCLKSKLPKSLFHLRKATSNKNSSQGDVSLINSSLFKLNGKCEIKSNDLKKIGFFLTITTENSALEGNLSVTLKSDLVFNFPKSGFLTIGRDTEKSFTIWNRRWCVLDGSKLKYWNTPSEEISEPINAIDLADCAVQEVVVAERTVCPRPRTLQLVIHDTENTVKNYFLLADKTCEMSSWQSDLNYVISTLRSWNRMNRKEEMMTSL